MTIGFVSLGNVMTLAGGAVSYEYVAEFEVTVEDEDDFEVTVEVG